MAASKNSEKRHRDLLVRRYSSESGSLSAAENDAVAAEEPLEIRVEGKSVAIVMRTPGHDIELAAGFLVTEGVVLKKEDIFEISTCPSHDSEGNVVDVLLAGKDINLDSLTRHVFTSSSCGICGKATLDAAMLDLPPIPSDLNIDPELVLSLPDRLRQQQATFTRTGGLHGAAIFDAKTGEVVVSHEDVGRHNAVDKVIGHGFLQGGLPYSEHLLQLSGRVSFELMQKALAAGIPGVVAISAPSSLAVEFAERSGQFLAGFVRDGRMNVYAGAERLGYGDG